MAKRTANPSKAESGPGFLREQTTVLTFEGTAYEGVEIEVVISTSGREVRERLTADYTMAESLSQDEQFLDEIVRSWNLQDADGDLPADASSYGRVPQRLLRMLALKWVAQVTGAVPDFLGNGSASGSR